MSHEISRLDQLSFLLPIIWKWLAGQRIYSERNAPFADIIIACLHDETNKEDVCELALQAQAVGKGKMIIASGAYAELILTANPKSVKIDTLGGKDLFSTLRNARQLAETELGEESQFNSAIVVCGEMYARRLTGLWNNYATWTPELAICSPEFPADTLSNEKNLETYCRAALQEVKAIQKHTSGKEMACSIPPTLTATLSVLEDLLNPTNS